MKDTTGKASDSIVQYDQDSMELEWSKQGERTKEYGELLADAKYSENVREGKLKLVEAQLAAAIRKHPEMYEIVKVTDEQVKQTALLQPEYRKTLSSLNKARRLVDYCKAALAGLKEKSTGMVETLKGQVAGFYGSPIDPTGRIGTSRLDVKIKKKGRK